jgi:hypothetical protein
MMGLHREGAIQIMAISATAALAGCTKRVNLFVYG